MGDTLVRWHSCQDPEVGREQTMTSAMHGKYASRKVSSRCYFFLSLLQPGLWDPLLCVK